MSDAIAQAIQKMETDLAATLSALSPAERGLALAVVFRALNVYITAAKFENPPRFKIPDYILKPVLEQPAPPRTP